jgi:hypothetical protein
VAEKLIVFAFIGVLVEELKAGSGDIAVELDNL